MAGSPTPAKKKLTKPVPLGTDPAFVLPVPGGPPLIVTYWDLCFSIVAAREHGGDLVHLADRPADGTRTQFLGQESVRRRRAHIRDLRLRLTAADQSVDQIVTAAGDLARPIPALHVHIRLVVLSDGKQETIQPRRSTIMPPSHHHGLVAAGFAEYRNAREQSPDAAAAQHSPVPTRSAIVFACPGLIAAVMSASKSFGRS